MVSSVPWRQARFAVVDVETTGLDPAVDSVLSVAVVPVDRGRIVVGSALYRTLRPAAPLRRESILIHGIRPVEAAAADDPEDVVDALVTAIRGRVLVAHVARVERGFLAPLLARRGLVVPRRVVDTDVLTREVIRREEHRLVREPLPLSACARLFGLPVHRMHHALGDALTAAQLLLAAATHLSPDGSWTTARLARADRRHRLAALAYPPQRR
ncbi:MAG: 3'-5' exonuclease [Actinomycetia bacterium]|nr:3'-5' exonuclease [Actinomycetes bacterium]